MIISINRKMKVLTKTLTLILLLPIFLLNFPVVLPGSCPAKPAMQKMACCAKVAPHQNNGHRISKPTCCSVSASPTPIQPIEAAADLSNGSVVNSGKYSMVFSSEIPFYKEKQQKWVFNGFIQSNFLFNLKIYSFISSYLI